MVVLLLSVGCDQSTKSLARTHLRDSDAVTMLGGTIRLEYAENPGGFLSLGDHLPGRWRSAAFTGIGIAGALALFTYALFFSSDRIQVVAVSLMCAGAVGNLLDRLFWGGNVTDFLNVGIGPVRTGIFNVADVSLMAGALLLALTTRSARANRAG